jgi:hypothetical protein
MTKTISFKKGTTIRVLSGEYKGRLAVVTRSSKFSVICKSPDEVYEWNLLKIWVEKAENVEMINSLQNEFRKKGFIEDPRGIKYSRSLYNPETKISVHIRGVLKSYVSINVFDMVNDGMNWGTAYNKISSGVEIKFKFKEKSFEDFYSVTFQNRVKKLNKLLAGK